MRNWLLLLPLSAACSSDYMFPPEKEANEAPEQEEEPIVEEEPEEEPEPVDTADSGLAPSEGESTGDPDDPVAVCSVSPNPVEPPYTTATWDGSASYDPHGLRITQYNWTLVSQPTGSSVRMPSGSGAVRAGFSPDLAGEYVGRLEVITEDGRRSGPCEVTLTSIPSEDLWIEMYWGTSNDDMDLHLLAPGGSILSDYDCYYANCVTGGLFGSLDWGTRGDTSDDPALDLDDIPGVGPENINIGAPQNGTFTVIVHDYSGSTPDYYGANSVTVNIYVAGRLAWTDTRNISNDGDYIEFATVDWPSGTVTSR